MAGSQLQPQQSKSSTVSIPPSTTSTDTVRTTTGITPRDRDNNSLDSLREIEANRLKSHGNSLDIKLQNFGLNMLMATASLACLGSIAKHAYYLQKSSEYFAPLSASAPWLNAAVASVFTIVAVGAMWKTKNEFASEQELRQESGIKSTLLSKFYRSVGGIGATVTSGILAYNCFSNNILHNLVQEFPKSLTGMNLGVLIACAFATGISYSCSSRYENKPSSEQLKKLDEDKSSLQKNNRLRDPSDPISQAEGSNLSGGTSPINPRDLSGGVKHSLGKARG